MYTVEKVRGEVDVLRAHINRPRSETVTREGLTLLRDISDRLQDRQTAREMADALLRL